MKRSPFNFKPTLAGAVALAAGLAACSSAGVNDRAAPVPAPAVSTPTASAAPAPVTPAPSTPAAPASNTFVAPPPIPFDNAIARAGSDLLAAAQSRLGGESRTLVIDPLIDANTGAQTQSTVRMGSELAAIVAAQHAAWAVKPLTRQALSQQPLLLIGTLTPVNVERSVDTPPDAFRVWLTLIDLRTGRVVAKQLDRATVGSVNPEPLKYYSDSPTWHKDKTVQGYINSCQINTKIGDPADPDYLARLPAAATVNEAIMAYDDGDYRKAHALYTDAKAAADPGDLRVLNGLYLTSWRLGQRDAAASAFDQLVDAGLELKRLPLKLLFRPASTSFESVGDLAEQYRVWIGSLARETGKVDACVRIVGHTSRTGDARKNELLSRRRAEAVQKLLEQGNRTLSTRLSAAGVGSKEALVGLGTDDLRDALDRRVEFKVVDCL